MKEIKLNQNDLKLVSMLSNATTTYDKYIVMLKNDFGYNLSKSELSKVMKVSQQTIDRRIKEAINLPSYLKSGDGSRASYIFPVVSVAEYLVNTIKVK